MARLVTYLVSCAVTAGVVWWMAATRPEPLMVVLWAIAWGIGLVVTWRVARRDGRHAPLWLLAALVAGPLAWIAFSAAPQAPVAGAPAEGRDRP
jgi:hypothetical protein